MDLKIKGKKAIICASSRGLGKGCANSLGQEGAELFINGINEKNLKLLNLVNIFGFSGISYFKKKGPLKKGAF